MPCRRNHGPTSLLCQFPSSHSSNIAVLSPTRLVLVGLLVAYRSQQHASVPQGRICADNFTCCQTEIEVADQTFYLNQSQYTDTGPTSPRADPIMPGAWQGSHWSANFEVTGMTRPEADALTTRPTRRSPFQDKGSNVQVRNGYRDYRLSSLLRVISYMAQNGLTWCQCTVTGSDGKWDMPLLPQCGNMHNCPGRYVLEIRITRCSDYNSPANNKNF